MVHIFIVHLQQNLENERDGEVDRDRAADELEAVVAMVAEDRAGHDPDHGIEVAFVDVPEVVLEIAIVASDLGRVLETKRGKRNV